MVIKLTNQPVKVLIRSLDCRKFIPIKSADILIVVVCNMEKEVGRTEKYYKNNHTPLSILSFTKDVQERALILSKLKVKSAVCQNLEFKFVGGTHDWCLQSSHGFFGRCPFWFFVSSNILYIACFKVWEILQNIIFCPQWSQQLPFFVRAFLDVHISAHIIFVHAQSFKYPSLFWGINVLNLRLGREDPITLNFLQGIKTYYIDEGRRRRMTGGITNKSYDNRIYLKSGTGDTIYTVLFVLNILPLLNTPSPPLLCGWMGGWVDGWMAIFYPLRFSLFSSMLTSNMCLFQKWT